MNKVFCPAEAVYGSLVVVISRISDLFGIGSRFGSLETVFFLSFSLALRDLDQSFSPSHSSVTK